MHGYLTNLVLDQDFAEVYFGDVEGHPFHGNQYTGGEGEDIGKTHGLSKDDINKMTDSQVKVAAAMLLKKKGLSAADAKNSMLNDISKPSDKNTAVAKTTVGLDETLVKPWKEYLLPKEQHKVAVEKYISTLSALDSGKLSAQEIKNSQLKHLPSGKRLDDIKEFVAEGVKNNVNARSVGPAIENLHAFVEKSMGKVSPEELKAVLLQERDNGKYSLISLNHAAHEAPNPNLYPFVGGHGTYAVRPSAANMSEVNMDEADFDTGGTVKPVAPVSVPALSVPKPINAPKTPRLKIQKPVRAPVLPINKSQHPPTGRPMPAFAADLENLGVDPDFINAVAMFEDERSPVEIHVHTEGYGDDASKNTIPPPDKNPLATTPDPFANQTGLAPAPGSSQTHPAILHAIGIAQQAAATALQHASNAMTAAQQIKPQIGPLADAEDDDEDDQQLPMTTTVPDRKQARFDDEADFRDWSQGKRDKMKEDSPEDFAGGGTKFPIRNQTDVDSAAKLIGHAADPSAVKSKIKAIAKRKGLSIPDAWKDEDKPVAMSEERRRELLMATGFGNVVLLDERK